ncbi:MAG TPA: flagellar export protein FliJ [Nitrosomonas sp.]|nr:flagellar export protein FliJ [Nitrosomonas sp.]
MPKSSLHTLIELTRQQMDSAAKKLGLFNTHLQTAEKKLELLTHYRTNYQVHLQNTMKQGIGHTQWHNFNSFMHKLDSAVNEQQQNVEQAKNNRNIIREEFLSYQRKLKSFETLLKRQQQTEQLRQTKIEQKLMDEFATSNYIRNLMNQTDP